MIEMEYPTVVLTDLPPIWGPDRTTSYPILLRVYPPDRHARPRYEAEELGEYRCVLTHRNATSEWEQEIYARDVHIVGRTATLSGIRSPRDPRLMPAAPPPDPPA